MKNTTITALSSRNPLPVILTWIWRPSHSILGPILVRNRSTWPTQAHFSQNSWLLHGHVPSVQKRAPPRKHEFQLSLHFWDFISIWVGLYLSYLFYVIHNSKGQKCSGLFCTKLQVLWFLTLVILLVKHVNSLIWVEFICKAILNGSIDILIYPFCCTFRALWLIRSWATGAPIPIGPIHMVL